LGYLYAGGQVFKSPEPLVNYDNLSLTKYDNVHFVGDALSARGITVSGAQGTYVAENLLKQNKNEQEGEILRVQEN